MEPGDIDIPVGCVIRAIDGSGLGRDDFAVTSVSQLDGEFQLNDSEELIGHIIKVEIRTETETLKVSNNYINPTIDLKSY